MLNVKNSNGSFKGIIGECMFKLAKKEVFLTAFFNKNKYFLLFGKWFRKEQKDFLYTYWRSFDGIEVTFNFGKPEIILYEIKTKNKYHKDLGFKPKMTQETHMLYHESKNFGIIPKLVTVWFHDNWEYTIEINEFNERNYC